MNRQRPGLLSGALSVLRKSGISACTLLYRPVRAVTWFLSAQVPTVRRRALTRVARAWVPESPLAVRRPVDSNSFFLG